MQISAEEKTTKKRKTIKMYDKGQEGRLATPDMPPDEKDPWTSTGHATWKIHTEGRYFSTSKLDIIVPAS